MSFFLKRTAGLVFVVLCASGVAINPVRAEEVVGVPNVVVTVLDANSKVLSGADVKVYESSASGAPIANDRLKAGLQDATAKTNSLGKSQFGLGAQSQAYYIVASYTEAVVDRMMAQVTVSASNQSQKQSVTIKLPFTHLLKPTLTVTVVDANNVPLPGAEVVVRDSEDPDAPIADNFLKIGSQDASGKTNSNGKASFGLAPRGDKYYVKARYYLPASGWDWNFARVEIDDFSNTSAKIHLDLVNLKPNLTVTVVDANDKILPGAEVAVRMGDEDGALIADNILKAGSADAAGKADSNGKIRFGLLPKSSVYFVKARYFGTDGWDWGFMNVAVADVGLKQQFKIKLGTTNLGPNVIVTILDANNKPLPGAKVTVYDSQDSGASVSNDISKPGYEDATETSKSNGNADFVLRPHGTKYYVKATYAGTEFDWKGTPLMVENLNPGNIYKFSLKFSLPNLKPNVTVTVVDAYGKALPGATVIVKDGGDANDPTSNDVLKTGVKDASQTTNSNGKVRFGLTPRTGSYKYYILAKYAGTEADWNATYLEIPDIAPGHTHAVKLRLGITNLKPNLIVTVVDANDKALPGAKVIVYHEGNSGPAVSNDITKKGGADASEFTKSTGKADFGVLPRSDAYTVTASFNGLMIDVGVRKVFIPDVEPTHKHYVKIQLAYTNVFKQNVTVTVVDANNKPLSGAKVTVYDGSGSGASVSNDFMKSGTKDAVGLTNSEGKKKFGLVPRTAAYSIVGSYSGTVSDSNSATLTMTQGSDLANNHNVLIKLAHVNAPLVGVQQDIPTLVTNSPLPTTSPTSTPLTSPDGATTTRATPTAKSLVGVTIRTTGLTTLTTGQHSPLEALAAYNDGTQSYVTYQCRWSTSDPLKALVQDAQFYSLTGTGTVDAVCEYTEGSQTFTGKLTFTIQLDPALQPITGGSSGSDSSGGGLVPPGGRIGV